MNPRTPTLFWFLTVSMVLVFFGLGEAVLRWNWSRQPGDSTGTFPVEALFLKSSDPELVYEVLPGVTLPGEEEPVVINSDGFRDDPFVRDKPESTYRILVLGDSVGWGHGVPTSAAFPRLLEETLNTEKIAGASREVEVCNFSIEGYSTTQEVRLLEVKGLDFHPDLILVAYVLNDPDVVDGGLSRYFNPPRCYWMDAIKRAVYNFRATRIGVQGKGYAEVVHTLFRDQILANLDRFARISESHSVPILFAIIPAFLWQPDVYAEATIHSWLGEELSRRGLLVHDLRPAFAGLSAEDYSLDVWHPNREGHRIIAEDLVRYFQEGGFPSAPTHPESPGHGER